MEIKHFLKDHAYQNIPLNYEEAYSLGCYALKGCNGDSLAQIQSITALSALHTRATYNWGWEKETEHSHGHRLPKNAAEQIAGVCAAIFMQDIARSKFGFIRPKIEYAMDNCGMGGDLVVTANVSTIAAFIASAAGIPMCKHGSPANADQGRHGSSDFVDLLGIDLYADKNEIEKCVEEESFGYTEALDVRYKQIHLQTHKIAMLPHMNDIIGPVTNPLCTRLMTRRVLGLNHLIPPRIVAEAYQILNQREITFLQHGIFIRGFVDKNRYRGIDEVSICKGGTQVAELKNNIITEYNIGAKSFGINTVPVQSISPPKSTSKGVFSFDILKGKIGGPPVEMVLANASLLFYLAGRSSDFKECYSMAQYVYSKGYAYEKMLQISKKLPKRR